MKTKFSVAVDCFLPGRVRTYLHPCNCMTNTYCCVYSVETPDDGQYVCPKHIEFCTKINLRNSASCWLLLLEYIYIYITITLLWMSNMCRSFLSVHILFTKHAVLLLRIPLYYFNANSIIDIKIKSTKTRFFLYGCSIFFVFYLSFWTLSCGIWDVVSDILIKMFLKLMDGSEEQQNDEAYYR